MWTVQFRDGSFKRFKFPNRTTPEGSIDPYANFSEAKRKGLDLTEPAIKELQTEGLIVGGGASGCGSAVEAMAWGRKYGVKTLLVEKAALERFGALAQGLSAINTYIGLKQGHNTVNDYTRMVHMDLMHLTRMERIFICKILMDAKEPNRVAGVAGNNVRENEVVIIKANAVIFASGGCVNVYRTRSQGEGV